ncbi:MAG: cyclic nucleotide-binding domain-containing protein [Pseudomonadota bacterium]
MAEALLLHSSIWVHIASTLYVIGFWVRDQLNLRILVLLGTVFYIIYYYYAAGTPLWSAIFWSTILGIVNLYVTIQLALERTTFRMSPEERRLYGVFGSLTPGEFRKLTEKGIWKEAKQPEILTKEGTPNRSLFYIVEGQVTLEKRGRSFVMSAGTFVGEVSYLLKSPATATVHADEKTRYIEWRHEDLLEIERRYQGIRIALREMLNADLAAKVAEGHGGRCSCELSNVIATEKALPSRDAETTKPVETVAHGHAW